MTDFTYPHSHRPVHRDTDFLVRIFSRLLNGNTAMLPMDYEVAFHLIDERDRLLNYTKEHMPMRHQLFQKAMEAGKSFDEALAAGIMRTDIVDITRQTQLLKSLFESYDDHLKGNGLEGEEPSIVTEVREFLTPTPVDAIARPTVRSLPDPERSDGTP
jgi:hypothetical protein